MPNQVYFLVKKKVYYFLNLYLILRIKNQDFFLKISINYFYILKTKFIKIYIYTKIGIDFATKMCFYRHNFVKIVKKNILVAVLNDV